MSHPVYDTGMATGFGAAFGGLLLVAVLSGLAGLLGLVFAGALVARKRLGTVPRRVWSLSGALVLGVILVAGFAVVALVDEAPILAVVFFGTVFVPLGAVGIYLSRVPEVPPHETVGAAGLAWSLPFLVGGAVTFGLPIVINSVGGPAPAAARQLGVYWLATALGASVVVLGALRLSKYISQTLYSPPAP